jgi:hypothetical protein
VIGPGDNENGWRFVWPIPFLMVACGSHPIDPNQESPVFTEGMSLGFHGINTNYNAVSPEGAQSLKSESLLVLIPLVLKSDIGVRLELTHCL